MNHKPFYITTAIDYVNGVPHVGHGFEKILTDSFARYERARGRDVKFLTGTDENSIKNVQAAESAGLSTEELVKQNSDAFESLVDTLSLSNDDFIRTTQKRHFDGAQKLWQAFNQDDLYKKDYTGLYCDGCEEFKTESDLDENGNCPEHKKPPTEVHEENWFFRLSNYQDKLTELIESDSFHIYPEFRKNEVLSFITSGLEDFSISRSNERAKNWGVPVPGDDTQMMYVWVDALSNYITALDYAGEGGDFTTYWNEGESIHVIGKGILRFHAVYWPAMLLSAGVALPQKIYVHEYFTVEGEKMSKSLGNVLAPSDLVERYGIDGTRYLLMSSMPYTKDGDISFARMDEKYNADLANGLGNLTSRVITLAGDIETEMPTVDLGALQKEMYAFNVGAALEKVWKLVTKANQYIEATKPWELRKNDEAQFEEVMQRLLQDLHIIATYLTPFMPATAQSIHEQIETREKKILFERLEK